jgi:hypothetical protein
VRAVFVSASSNSDWGASILGNLPLAPGSSTTLTFSGDCSTHDLRIVVDGSAEFSDDDLQFCFSDNSILSITMTGRALRKAKVARP